MADTVNAPPAVSVGEQVGVRIRSVAAGGAGVGDLPDGRVVFVHGTVPGDWVEAKVTRLRPRWGQATLKRVLEPGPGRIAPLCPLYGSCGGCTLQHMAYEGQLEAKAAIVREALTRIGTVAVPTPEVVPSPRVTGYRNRMTFTVRSLSKSHVVAGLHALEDPDRIVDVRGECVLPEPVILEVWGALRRSLDAGRSPFPKGRELRVTLRSLEDGRVTLAVRGGAPGWDGSAALEAAPGLSGIWHQPAGTVAPLRVAGEESLDRWGDEVLPVDGHAFLQVNRTAARHLSDHVLAVAPPEPGRAVDAYAGVGVYGRALARLGWQVTALEADAHACEGARHEAPAGFSVIQGRVEERLHGVLPAELVIVNPPRSGLHEGVPGTLLRVPPSTVVYVSCDPATLARDARLLQEGFDVASLRSFDLFPHTSHVETVAVFTRRPTPGSRS